MNRITFPTLMLTLSLASILCRGADPNADQARTIAEIEKLGGKVTVKENGADKRVIEVNLAKTKVTDAGLEHLKGLTQLQSLNLVYANVTDTGQEGTAPGCQVADALDQRRGLGSEGLGRRRTEEGPQARQPQAGRPFLPPKGPRRLPGSERSEAQNVAGRRHVACVM